MTWTCDLDCISNVQPGLVQSAIIRLCERGVLGQLAAPEDFVIDDDSI